jgi:hypothetical protein
MKVSIELNIIIDCWGMTNGTKGKGVLIAEAGKENIRCWYYSPFQPNNPRRVEPFRGLADWAE